ncbi:MAG: phosphoribosylformylglycinamidine synthase subunit PurL [Oligoflexales bacterium]
MNDSLFPQSLKNLQVAKSFNPFKDHEHCKSMLEQHKLSETEFQKILEILGRSPSLAELGVFSAMWSEHCSYKSSRIHLKRLPSSGPDVVVGPGENAGVVRVWNQLCVAFKMESHNHPSFIDPYQGAATGVGGILRDVFCMGARPIANLNSLRFGEKAHPKTQWLASGVVKGIGDYGNCIGVPTVGGSVSFDSSYNGNILVNAMTVGIIHENAIFKGHASGEGNLVIYVGSATGRDGIHGATMASDSFDSEDASERSAIQVGDPFCEKLLLEATLEALKNNLVVGIQDMGAAGLTSSLFEMADRGNSGLLIDLEKVPVRTTKMSAYELLLSESQERMAMVVEEHKWPQLKRIFDKWQLSHAIIGKVTDSGRVKAIYKGVIELDVPVSPLAANAPCYDRPRKLCHTLPQKCSSEEFMSQISKEFYSFKPNDLLKLMIAQMHDSSWVYSQYDHHIGNKTVLGPSEQGSAILWLDPQNHDLGEIKDLPPYLGIAASTACLESYCRIDPMLGAAHSVMKAARSIIATGAKPLAITDCLNYGNPCDPEVMESFAQGVDGIKLACDLLEIPVVSGNVSLYNETDGKSIAPTPMIGMVGKIHDVRKAIPANPDKIGDLYLLGPRKKSLIFSGSSLVKALQISSQMSQLAPIIWDCELESMSIIQKLVAKDALIAARDLGGGGALGTSLKMALQSPFGLEWDNPLHPEAFCEEPASYLLVSKKELTLKELGFSRSSFCKLEKIGAISKQESIVIAGSSFNKKELVMLYKEQSF